MAVAGAGQARAVGVAYSDFVFTIQEEGGDVVGTGAGNVNLSGLVTAGSDDTAFAYMDASGANVAMGSTAVTSGDAWEGPLNWGPTSFGSGSLISATSSSGNVVALDGGEETILVPTGYVSGTSLSNSATWSGASYSTLGLTPGTYTYTWGGGNIFTVDVLPVPEPSQYGALIFFALAALVVWRRLSRLAA